MKHSASHYILYVTYITHAMYSLRVLCSIHKTNTVYSCNHHPLTHFNSSLQDISVSKSYCRD